MYHHSSTFLWVKRKIKNPILKVYGHFEGDTYQYFACGGTTTYAQLY